MGILIHIRMFIKADNDYELEYIKQETFLG